MTSTKTYTGKKKISERFALFPCKMAFFKRVWWKVKVLSCPWAVGSKLPLFRPLKWGTKRLWTLSGSKNMSRQKIFDFHTWTLFFSCFQIWRVVFLEPLGVKRCYVPHFKGLISGNLEPTAQGHDITFTFHHALLKKAFCMKNRLDIFSSQWCLFVCLSGHLPQRKESGCPIRDSVPCPGVGIGNTPYQVLPVEFRHVPGLETNIPNS